MRHLAQPKTLMMAIIAALASALACYPRLALWLNRPAELWYLETMIFLCCIVLWGFVFAWHTRYSGRPVFNLRPEVKLFAIVTLVGILFSIAFHFLIDPALREKVPDEFPIDLKHWFADLLFALSLNQLFLLFAPFAWLLRLFKNQRIAAALTIAFGVFIIALKLQSTPISSLLCMTILLGKLITGIFAVVIYLRGGVLLVWWWTLLFEARHLLDLL